MRKCIVCEEVRVDSYGEKRFWVEEDLSNDLMIVPDCSAR